MGNFCPKRDPKRDPETTINDFNGEKYEIMDELCRNKDTLEGYQTCMNPDDGVMKMVDEVLQGARGTLEQSQSNQVSQLDPYIVLNVKRDADAEAIRKAYVRKARETHPDKSGTSVDFRKTQWAYDILSDDEKKSRYDKGIVLDVDKFVQFRF